MKFKLTILIVLSAVFFLSLSFYKINPTNPPAGRTGAPGETTCQAAGCHADGSYTGSLELTGLPDTVVANQSYSLTLINTSNAIKAGFQLTVLDSSNVKVGTLTAGNGCSLANSGGRQYVRQSIPHTLSNGSTSWTFDWKAPASVPNDSIHFYFASLCANGNGQKTGDNALKNSKSVVLPTFVSAVNDDSREFNLNFFPNPAKDFVTIEIPGRGDVKMMDENGKVVLRTEVVNSKQLDISGLPNGLYFASVQFQGNLETRVFIKN
ncbi:MAG: T9SS type A sorting domain-containing protein [Saprospiraceae bacterium]|nr:T9SS type A sorting domain-containing protein [Saprospiraceae bacterium]MCF8249303.1 T9SS type A sorting domain-containing protein [Saprospiraceae bacterium]MCF8279724.1 T9SS type A sorting domain-containing protein [Bacteroidales bacterium]MCF8311420.1 T9SS type A sorting domain-containing protein [Saprospiraceae bacterium]MCF8439922.1 T9SS type A sorting domain-containing protein [Saprospiraceae bacterium]